MNRQNADNARIVFEMAINSNKLLLASNFFINVPQTKICWSFTCYCFLFLQTQFYLTSKVRIYGIIKKTKYFPNACGGSEGCRMCRY